MRTFDSWEIQDLQLTFHLTRHYDNFAPLEEWISAEPYFDEAESAELEELRIEMFRNAEFWNEEELKMKFIGALVRFSKLEETKLTVFYNRWLKGVVENVEMGGIVDMMLASGFQKPIEPYLMIHEYKQERKRQADPLGQLMAEMLTAQANNQQFEAPIYGCYVLGRMWFFVVLMGKDFAVSKAFDAADKPIRNIAFILRRSKKFVVAAASSFV